MLLGIIRPKYIASSATPVATPLFTKKRSIKDRFDQYYTDFTKKRQESPFCFVTGSHTGLIQYQKIIQLGEAAIPFITKELRAGDFYLNRALMSILGIKQSEFGEIPLSEQDISKKLLEHAKVIKLAK